MPQLSTRDGTGTGRAGPAPDAGTYRVIWVPGSDRLLGVCHCGAEQAADDPVRVWQWLFAHPDHAITDWAVTDWAVTDGATTDWAVTDGAITEGA